MDDVHVDLAPPLTADQLAENEAFQNEMAQRFSIVPGNHARRVVDENLELLLTLSQQFAASDDEDFKAQIAIRADLLKKDTTDWMRTLGYFDAASHLHPDENARNRFLAYAEAERLPNDHWCEHPKWKLENNKKTPNYYREFDYTSPATGKRLTMMKCAECDNRNAMETPSDILELDAKRAAKVTEYEKKH